MQFSVQFVSRVRASRGFLALHGTYWAHAYCIAQRGVAAVWLSLSLFVREVEQEPDATSKPGRVNSWRAHNRFSLSSPLNSRGGHSGLERLEVGRRSQHDAGALREGAGVPLPTKYVSSRSVKVRRTRERRRPKRMYRSEALPPSLGTSKP